MVMRGLGVICAIGLLVLDGGEVGACAWDSDTLADKLATKEGSSLYDLLVGQIPHHGEVYYRARIARLEPKEQAGTATHEERNDLAVALMRVEAFGRAGAGECRGEARAARAVCLA